MDVNTNQVNQRESVSNKAKLTYQEMIEDAIITLAENQGSSRQALWKCVHAKYPEADYKLFVVRLKKLKENGSIVQNKGKFKLDKKHKKKLLNKIIKGKPVKKVKKSPATMKAKKLKQRNSKNR
jgi:histone H1/5